MKLDLGADNIGLEVLPGCQTRTEEVISFIVDNAQNPKALEFFKELNMRLKDLDIITIPTGNLLEVKILR